MLILRASEAAYTKRREASTAIRAISAKPASSQISSLIVSHVDAATNSASRVDDVESGPAAIARFSSQFEGCHRFCSWILGETKSASSFWSPSSTNFLACCSAMAFCLAWY